MNEEQIINKLVNYKRLLARIRVLENFSIGTGVTVSRFSEDDQLQELHSRLRGLPSYMYLNAREQKLETTAHAYLTHYPVGVKSQLAAIPTKGADQEDDRLLRELRSKIERVVESRGWDIRNDFDAVLDRVDELQKLQQEIEQIDSVLDEMEQYMPDFVKLLRVHYIDRKPWDEASAIIGVSKTVFYTWRKKALREYAALAR